MIVVGIAYHPTGPLLFRGMADSVKAESMNGSIEFLGKGLIIKTKGTLCSFVTL
jgi:hypothetical protein